MLGTSKFTTIGLLALTGVLLASCGQTKQFVTIKNCPAVGIVAHMGTVTQFNSAQKTNEDVIFDATISDIEYICDDQNAVNTTISFTIQGRRGPAMQGEVHNLTYYIVVIRDNYLVTTKKQFTTQLNFSGGADKASVRETVVQRFDNFEMLERYDYEVMVGFELSPDELRFNVIR